MVDTEVSRPGPSHRAGTLTIGVAVAILLARFVILFLGLQLAAAIGIEGWHSGLFVNVLVSIYAVILMSRYHLWTATGMTTLWRSRMALIWLLPLIAEAGFWALGGLVEQPPGFGLWALTLLLVGVNEELISRGVILSRLRSAYRPLMAVIIGAALFGLQHLSALALTSRAVDDVLGNVLFSAIYGFALGAYQLRFRWLWPLILIHAATDFTTVLSASFPPEILIIGLHVLIIAYGLALISGRADGDGAAAGPRRWWRSPDSSPG